MTLKINGKTKIIGILGYPVEHSKSPQMHNKAYEHLKLNYAYVPMEVAPGHIKAALEGIRSLGISGVNVTIPHKESVIPYLDELKEEARLIGAVNTIKNDNGKLIGHNTDGQGFIRDIKRLFNIDLSGKKVLLIGAGGAARAISVSLLIAKTSSLLLVDIDTGKAKSLANYLSNIFGAEIGYCSPEDPAIEAFLQKTDLVVNASPVGMHPDIEGIPFKNLQQIKPETFVYDIVYNPEKTRFVQLLEESGHTCANGLGMLAGQGAIGFEIFTGRKIDTEKMIKYLNDH